MDRETLQRRLVPLLMAGAAAMAALATSTHARAALPDAPCVVATFAAPAPAAPAVTSPRG